MKKIALSAALIAASALTANAATSKAFTGFYVGGNLGYVNSNVKNKVVSQSISADLNKSQRSTGLLYGIYGGYGVAQNSLYIGFELYTLKDTAKREISYKLSSGTFKFKNEQGLTIGLATKLGYIFGDNLVYAKLGIESKKHTATLSDSSPQLIWNSTRLTALVPGFGYERAFNNILVRAEYSYVSNDVYKLGDTKALKTLIKLSSNDHRVTVGAAYKF